MTYTTKLNKRMQHDLQCTLLQVEQPGAELHRKWKKLLENLMARSADADAELQGSKTRITV